MSAQGKRPRRRLLLIHNPEAGGPRERRRLAGVVARLQGRGCSVELRTTEAPGQARTIARAAAGSDADAVVAAGGDGTVNEVVNGLRDTGLALGLVPLGTANVFAAEIGLPVNADGIARVLLEGPEASVHLGCVNGRLFTMMAGIGFDAHAVAAVEARRRRRLGKLAYVLAGLAVLARGARKTYRIRIDGTLIEAAGLVAANGRYYAGRYVLAPDADVRVPELHACLFLRRGRWNTARYVLAVYRGRLGALADARIVPARRIEVMDGGEEPVQADGDLVAALPATLTLHPRPLRVIVPPPP